MIQASAIVVFAFCAVWMLHAAERKSFGGWGIKARQKYRRHKSRWR